MFKLDEIIGEAEEEEDLGSGLRKRKIRQHLMNSNNITIWNSAVQSFF